MKTLSAIIVCASIALPFAAYADMSDADYCNKLSQTYRTVVGSNAAAAGNVPEAMAGCATNPKASIPTLEKALQDNKVTLPSRN
jgi:hypothetical protein